MNKNPTFIKDKSFKDTKILAGLLAKFLAKKKIEKYKHLDLDFLRKRELSLSPLEQVKNFDIKDIKHFLLDESNFYNLVFINAEFKKNLSNFPESLKIKNIKNDEKNTEETKSSLKSLNTFFNQEILEFNFTKTVDKPIAFIHINTAKNESYNNLAVYIKHKIHLQESVQIEIFDKFVNFRKNDLFNNNVFEIQLNNNSKLDHFIHLESENNLQFNHYKIGIDKKASYKCFFLNQKSKISRLDFEIDLNNSEAQADIKGIYLAKNNQILDHYIKTSHNDDRTSSNLFIKGMLDDTSKGIFYASTTCQKDVSTIVAKQLNKNILLSKTASCFSKPELWIKSDDVKCFHGSTTGQLDDDALFYLQTRGFDESQATKILQKAFIEEIFSEIKNKEIKKYFEKKFI